MPNRCAPTSPRGKLYFTAIVALVCISLSFRGVIAYRHACSFAVRGHWSAKCRETSLFASSSSSSPSSNRNTMNDEVVVIKSVAPYGGEDQSRNNEDVFIPSPLHQVVDVNLDRRSIVYEVELGRDLGLDIGQGNGYAFVSNVHKGSRAYEIGIKENDRIISTSATAGVQLWAHESEVSVRSALNTRFVMNPTAILRLERNFSEIPESILSGLKVPYEYSVKVKRPIGIHVSEGSGNSVVVQFIKEDGGAARARRVEVGDQIVEMSASWGDRMWEVTSVESFVAGVKMRTSNQLAFKVRRMVPLNVYTGQDIPVLDHQNSKQQRLGGKQAGAGVKDAAVKGSSSSLSLGDSNNKKRSNQKRGNRDSINGCKSIHDLSDIWNSIKKDANDGSVPLQQITVNTVMSKALKLEEPHFAADVFEESFDFPYNFNSNSNSNSNSDSNSNNDIKQVTAAAGSRRVGKKAARETMYENDIQTMHALAVHNLPAARVAKGKFRSTTARGGGDGPSLSTKLEPNNFVCTTASKAYGRMGPQNVNKAMCLIPWLESRSAEKPDVYLLTSVMYVCAKHKRVRDTESIFWDEMPRRGLAYTVATTNSLMYMYARTGRPDDALKVYELTKRLDLTCTVVTYGVLIKALLRSGKGALQDTSFEILRSLPELGINPGVEVYNQFFEHYAKMHDFRKVKMILRLMSDSNPRTKPDAVSYGHLIHCFAESRKPKSALSVYHQMLKRKIEPSSYTYMGILKALSHMKDGISCVQVLGEMRERGITPTKKHYAMTMFACLTCNQCLLAESVFNMSMKLGYKPDVVLYTLRLRAILQQGNWAEGMELLEKMKQDKEAVRPNLHTYNMLLQFQVLDGRYEDAANTLNVILKEQEKVKTAKGVKGVRVIDTMKALSFVMGPYSNHVQALKREEDEEDEFGSLEATALDLSGSVDSVGITGIVEDTSDNSLLHKVVEKPTKDGLHFLVSSTERMEHVTRVPIHGNFYMQILRAVVLEGHLGLMKRVLVLRDTGKVSMKEEDLVRVKPIEDIAHRALAQAADDRFNF